MPNTNFSGIGYGRVNNSNVMASSQSNAFPAFYLCDTLTLGGYKDWILPSSAELEVSVKSVYSFMNSSVSTKAFKGSQYWTSTIGVTSSGSEPYRAKYINFTPVESKEAGVWDKKYVRAIRYF